MQEEMKDVEHYISDKIATHLNHVLKSTIDLGRTDSSARDLINNLSDAANKCEVSDLNNLKVLAHFPLIVYLLLNAYQ